MHCRRGEDGVSGLFGELCSVPETWVVEVLIAILGQLALLGRGDQPYLGNMRHSGNGVADQLNVTFTQWSASAWTLAVPLEPRIHHVESTLEFWLDSGKDQAFITDCDRNGLQKTVWIAPKMISRSFRVDIFCTSPKMCIPTLKSSLINNFLHHCLAFFIMWLKQRWRIGRLRSESVAEFVQYPSKTVDEKVF